MVTPRYAYVIKVIMKDAYNDLNCLKASLILMGCHGHRMVCGFTSIKMCISSQCLSPLGTVR